MNAKYVETSSREKKSCMSMREKCTSRTDKRGKEFDSGLLGATYNKAFELLAGIIQIINCVFYYMTFFCLKK
jgi:hypothetical protein